MGKPTVNSRYYSGQGICMMGERDGSTGRALGLLPIGNVPELTLAISEATEEHKESWSGNRGTDAILSTETTVTVSITFESLDPENLVLGLKGSSTEQTSVTAETQTLKLYTDKWMPLEHLGVSNVTVEDAGGGGTTYVVNDDYEIDDTGGMVRAVGGGAITDGTDIDVTYDAEDQYDIQALVTNAPERFFLFNGLNTRDGKAVRLTIPRLQTQPFADKGYINDGIASFSMEARALADEFITAAGKSKFFNEKILK